MEENKCKGGGLIKSITIIQASDIVYGENGNPVRLKRKYGKFTRPVYSYDWGTPEAAKIIHSISVTIYPIPDINPSNQT